MSVCRRSFVRVANRFSPNYIGGISIPKIKRPKTNQPDIKTASGNNARTDAGTPEEVQTNPNAPPDYNANLNVGNKAVAVDHSRDAAGVKILAKSGTAYKVAKIKEPDAIQW